MKTTSMLVTSSESISTASLSQFSNQTIPDSRLRLVSTTQRTESFSMEGKPYSVDKAVSSFSHDLRATLAALRDIHVKINDGPTHYQILNDQPSQSDNLLRAVIGIPTRGCSYARTAWGGCAVCGHVSSMLWGALEESDAIVVDFEQSLGAILKASPQVLCLYTSGSFLDQHELPLSARNRILSYVAEIESVETVVIESLPHFISAHALDELCERLGGKQIRIGMGLDSSRDFIRTILYQRNIPTSNYQIAIELCQAYEIQTTAYIVLGNPLLSPETARADTIRSIEEAFSFGFSEVSIEPIALQPSTLQDAFQRSGLYEPPTIWDVVAVLNSLPKRIHLRADNLILGGQIFTPLPYASLSSCRECATKARMKVSFIRPEFWRGLPITDTRSCCLFEGPAAVNDCNDQEILQHAQVRLRALVDELAKKKGRTQTNHGGR